MDTFMQIIFLGFDVFYIRFGFDWGGFGPSGGWETLYMLYIHCIIFLYIIFILYCIIHTYIIYTCIVYTYIIYTCVIYTYIIYKYIYHIILYFVRNSYILIVRSVMNAREHIMKSVLMSSWGGDVILECRCVCMYKTTKYVSTLLSHSDTYLSTSYSFMCNVDLSGMTSK